VTSNHLRRRARTLAGVVCVAIGLTAGASQATMRAEPAFPGSAVSSEQGGVRIVGGDADSAIETEVQADGTIVITDLAGVSTANDPFPEDGFGCSAIDSTRARCDFPSEGGLDAFLGAGDDVLATDRAQPGQLVGTGGSGGDSVVLPMGSEVHLRFRGNQGADVIAGASANDLLRGGPGADLLRGRAGADVVNGKKGRDQLLGGSGDDSLHARHRDRDKRIDCGRGADRAAVDRHIDPRPVGCEEVRRRS
jgi:Ca2+-binding RTX toxin-like protein